MKHDRTDGRSPGRPWGRLVTVGVLSAALLTGGTTPGVAYEVPTGTAEIYSGYIMDMSENGRFIIYTWPHFWGYPDKPWLAPVETQEADFVLLDRQTGGEVVPNMGEINMNADWYRHQGGISDDGRRMVFTTDEPISTEDTDKDVDLYVWRAETNSSELITTGFPGACFYQAGISASGDYAVVRHVYRCDGLGGVNAIVYDLDTGEHEEPVPGLPTGSISRDGRFFPVYMSPSMSPPGDNSIRLHDRVTGTSELVSARLDGTPAPTPGNATVSPDGRYVSFTSADPGIIPNDPLENPGNGAVWSEYDTFVWDRLTKRTRAVTVDSLGRDQGHSNWSNGAQFSEDGAFVSYKDAGSDAIAGGTMQDLLTGSSWQVQLDDWFPPSAARKWATGQMFGGRYARFFAWTDGPYFGFYDHGPRIGASGLSVRRQGNKARVEGFARFVGAEVEGASDSSSDGDVVGALPAGELGGELVGADVVFRPEEEDLRFRFEVSNLPGIPNNPYTGVLPDGAPGLVYRFDYGRVHIRVSRENAPTARHGYGGFDGGPSVTADASSDSATCVVWTSVFLAGGVPELPDQRRIPCAYGTTGEEILAFLPGVWAKLVGPDPGLSASVAVGHAGSPPGNDGAVLDEVEISAPATKLPVPRVELGIAPAGTPEEQVSFTHEGTLSDGKFWGAVPIASLPSGHYDVWARGCLGEICGASSTPFRID